MHFEDLLVYLKVPPRMFNMIPSKDEYFGHEFFLDGAVDLYLLDLAHAVDTSVHSKRWKEDATQLDVVADPLARISLRGYRYLNNPWNKPTWPSRCGDFRGVRAWTVQFLTERSGTNDDKHHQAMTVQWRDYDGAQRFKDPMQRCTGIEFEHPNTLSNQTWEKDFVKPLESLERQGIASNVEHWTLVLQTAESGKHKREADKRLARRCRKYDREESMRKYGQRVKACAEAMLSTIKPRSCFENS